MLKHFSQLLASPSIHGPLSPNDQFKSRRVANHPCPVCGKSYVNEGSLRKHLACHPETSSLASSLRMWPCSVCQAVFTHEAGLLTHMEHMRMDPKHQFAAQYMLSRAAAERRDQVAAAIAGGSSLLSIGQNSRGASPSAHSDTSSCNGRLSSPPPDHHIENNNNNGSLNDSASDNNNNTNGTNNLSGGGNYNGKLSVNDVLRSQTSGHLHQQYQQVVAAANAITAAQQNCNGLGSPGNPATSAAQAVVNLAVAMRQNQPMSNGNQQSSPSQYHQNNQSMSHHGHQPQHHHQDGEAQLGHLLRSQAEAALRLAVSQAAAVVASNGNGTDGSPNNHNGSYRHHHNGSYANNHHQSASQHFSQQSELSEALRMQEQRLEQALRLHGGELGLHQSHHQNP